MSLLLITGIIIFSGFLLGELAARMSLPKISGYIIAGILLNPQVLGIVPHSYIEIGDPLVNISLAVITFHIGGSLSFDKIRKEGKNYLIMTLAESLLAYLLVFLLVFLTVQYVLIFLILFILPWLLVCCWLPWQLRRIPPLLWP